MSGLRVENRRAAKVPTGLGILPRSSDECSRMARPAARRPGRGRRPRVPPALPSADPADSFALRIDDEAAPRLGGRPRAGSRPSRAETPVIAREQIRPAVRGTRTRRRQYPAPAARPARAVAARASCAQRERSCTSPGRPTPPRARSVASTRPRAQHRANTAPHPGRVERRAHDPRELDGRKWLAQESSRRVPSFERLQRRRRHSPT